MQYLHTRLQSIMKVISVAGIHSGAVIHNQDQLTNPVRLMTRNTANTYTQILIPSTVALFDNIIKSPSSLLVSCCCLEFIKQQTLVKASAVNCYLQTVTVADYFLQIAAGYFGRMVVPTDALGALGGFDGFDVGGHADAPGPSIVLTCPL